MYNNPAANNKSKQEALRFYQWHGGKMGGIMTKEASIRTAQV